MKYENKEKVVKLIEEINIRNNYIKEIENIMPFKENDIVYITVYDGMCNGKRLEIKINQNYKPYFIKGVINAVKDDIAQLNKELENL